MTWMRRPVRAAPRRKILSVLGFSHGGGRDGGEVSMTNLAGQGLKAAERRKRAGAAFGVEAPRFRKPGAKGAHDLFVVEIGGASGGPVKHHKADRV